ncbi:MAG: Ig-like domain-containing protein [Planctomycetota bacterium]|jgi:hypothetical protein|nr:Ig-like domain-containing protein [Planctomycetota bacterium]
MLASRTSPIASRTLPALALLLTLGLFAGPCGSTGNPGTFLDPDNPGGGSGGDGGGGGIPPLEDGPSAAPMAGAILQDGPPSMSASAPADSATSVDPNAAMALWFNESLRADTVTSTSLRLRPVDNPLLGASANFTWLAGDRCVVMDPVGTLLPDTEYEVVATNDITDLEGERIALPSNGLLFRFRTADSLAGISPQVLGSFPPGGSTLEPNDTSVIVVFSEPMDFTGLTDAVSFTNLTTTGIGDYDTAGELEFRHVGNRVFEFPHLDDGNDLGATMRLDINTSITDAEFVPQFLAEAYQAEWDTLAFGRPSSIVFDDANFAPFDPAVNLQNVDLFPTDVTTPISVLSADEVTLLVHETNESEFVSATTIAGGGLSAFELDLTDSSGAPLFSSSAELVLASYVERDGVRSSVQTFRDSDGFEAVVSHDTVRPLLFSYGPPAGAFGSQFLTDTPWFRPYGLASEQIARIEASFPPGSGAQTRDVDTPSTANFFIGPAFDPLVILEGPLAFDITLTDKAGNAASTVSPGVVEFRGFLSATPIISGEVQVVAFDREGLYQISGATVFIEDFGGGNEDSANTGSDGSVSFSGRVGAQTITIQAEGFHAVSLMGFDASELSIPMIAEGRFTAAVSPLITGLSTGVTSISSNLLTDGNGDADANGVQTYDLENLFASGLDIRMNRPGWFAAFHDVVDFPSANRYFRFFAGDSRVLVDPTSGSTVVTPEFAMIESTNQIAGTTNYIYPIQASGGAGLSLPPESGNSLITTTIPGINGPCAVGAGSVDFSGGGTNGAAELELSLLGAAVAEGASAADVQLQIHAIDSDGDQAMARATVSVQASPAATPIALPDVPEVTAAWGGASYPYTRDFTDTLSGDQGYYCLTITDSAVESSSWQIWLAGSAGVGGSLTLPTLKETAGAAVGTPPLDTSSGGHWTATMQAFSMPLGFIERGFFFSELERDYEAWAQSADSPDLNF